jgi:hypothetical protein
MHDVGQIDGEELVMGYELLDGTEVSVTTSDDRSRWVPLSGLPEGRRNSNCFFAILASAFPEALRDRHVGVGLDPPEHGVVAYHLFWNGTTGQRPDVATCRKTAQQVAAGELSWELAMQNAASDADRLCLLDLGSPVKVGLRQYSDDNKVKSSSDGMLDVGAECLSAAVRSIRGAFKFGPGKTELPARGLPDLPGPEMLTGVAHQCDIHTGLGAPVDTALRMSPLLCQVDARGDFSMRSHFCAADGLGLPPEVLVLSLKKRIEPKSTYAAVFLVVRQDWEKRLDALPDRWIWAFLDLRKRVPRSLLMQELGLSSRLSARVFERAVGLLGRIHQLPCTHIVSKVATVAAKHTSTWTTAVVDTMMERERSS